jgi:hypothetical protein
MRISFTQSGGFTGIIKGCLVDTALLPDAQRQEVERLVSDSGLTDTALLAEGRSEEGRDLRQYCLEFHDSSGIRRVACDERCLPDAARPLVAYLASRSVPQPPRRMEPSRERSARPAASSGRWGRFEGSVVARWERDGRDMTLTEPFAYVDRRAERWEAAIGRVVNGASIPRAFWSLIGGPFTGRFRNASVVHDVACEDRDRPWRKVHRMFYEACRCGGVDAGTAKTMYYAVHHFGPRWRIEERATLVAGRKTVERVVHDETPRPPSEAEAAAIVAYFARHQVAAAAIPSLVIPVPTPEPEDPADSADETTHDH